MLIRTAIRNVMRNPRRTLITTSAMTAALIVMIIYTGLVDGFLLKFQSTALSLDLAHIQIHAREYRNKPSIYRGIPSGEEILEQLSEMKLVATPRLFAFGLAASNLTSSGVGLRGIDLERESRVTDLHLHVEAGSWLDRADPHGIVIGRKLARTLAASIGEEIVLVGQAADGSTANDLYRIRGILKGVSEEIDRSGLFLTDDAFRVFYSYDQGPHEIAIRLTEEMDAPTVRAHLAQRFPDVEVNDWRQLAPGIADMIDSTDIVQYLLYIIAYAAIGMVTLNAMLMAVFERIRELGILKAVGVTPLQILTMVVIEAMTQALSAAVIGTLIGLPAVLWLETHGINLAHWGDGAALSGIAINPIWCTSVTSETVITPMLFMLGIVLISIIYPGLKAAFVRPVRAIYHQ